MQATMAVEKADQRVVEGEGGGYYSWSTSKTPLQTDFNLSAGKLLLRPLGFALPHYSDFNKIGFLLQGTITVGLVTPNSSEEVVVLIKKGDAIPIPAGLISWWFNDANTDAVVVFLGEARNSLVPGQVTYFIMAGVLGFLAGFQSDYVSKTFGLDQMQSENLVNSQKGAMLVKVNNGIKFPEPSKQTKDQLYTSIEDQPCGQVVVKGGGIANLLTEKNFPVLSEIGLSARYVKLEGNAMLVPSYVVDGSVQMCYVSKGSGWIRIVGSDGKPVLDSKVEEGDLFIVPQFFASTEIADDCGMEVVSVITSSKPAFQQLAGYTSVLNALSQEVLQASLNITPDAEQLFKSKNSEIIGIVPPST